MVTTKIKEKMSTRTTKMNAKTITDVNGATTGNSEGEAYVEKSVSKSKFPLRKNFFQVDDTEVVP